MFEVSQTLIITPNVLSADSIFYFAS